MRPVLGVIVCAACGTGAARSPGSGLATRDAIVGRSPPPCRGAPADGGERALFDHVNTARAEAGLPALGWDARLAEVAADRARELRDHGVPVEEPALALAPRDRVRAAGIPTSLVLESVGQAPTPDAFAADLRARGAAANALSPLVTCVAIGIAAGDAELFVAELFIRPQPPVDTATLADDARRTLVRRYESDEDRDLTAIAADYARGLAAGATRAALWPEIRSRIAAIDRRFTRIEEVITVVADPELLELAAAIGDREVHAFGVGVAQGPHELLGDGALWVVILVGGKLGR